VRTIVDLRINDCTYLAFSPVIGWSTLGPLFIPSSYLRNSSKSSISGG